MPRQNKEETDSNVQLNQFMELLRNVEAVKEKFPELALKDGESAALYIDRIRPRFLELMTMKAFFGDSSATRFLSLLEEKRVEHQLMMAELTVNPRTGAQTARMVGQSSGLKALMNGDFRVGA